MSIEIKKGEILGLIGENGAGKSTLIKVLSGVIEPDGGSIRLEDETLASLSPHDAITRRIIVVYQDISLYPNLSVAENIASGSPLYMDQPLVNWRRLHKHAKEALAALGIDDIAPKTMLGDLAIAKQQLVAIARAFSLQPKILILDEPTACLSQEETTRLLEAMKRMKERGVSIVFVSHKLQELFAVCDRFSVLRDGKHIISCPTSDLNTQRLISYMVGRDIEYSIYPKRKLTHTEPLLELRSCSKKHNFKDISFQLFRGEVLGFYGLVGSGRTELLQSLCALEKMDCGEVRLKGQAVRIKSMSDAMRNEIAMISEDRLSEGLLASKNLSFNANLASIATKPLLKRRNAEAERQKAEELCETLRIKPKVVSMHANEFSGGNQQKIVIGKWLSRKPQVLLFDEPTHGIDVATKTEIHALIRELSEHGAGVIVVSSELSEIIAIADRVLVMSYGRVAAMLEGEKITQENIMECIVSHTHGDVHDRK